jgi:CubicO group peptidase (beta-lactamase class C family)
MKKIFAIVVFFIVLIFSNSCENEELINIDIDAEIINEINSKKIPSVVACIVTENGISWSGNYGYSNVEQSITVSNESVFTLMSITKLFVAISVMQLWENDKIDLQADINNYLPFDVRNPYFPDKKINTTHLLTHTSGLAWPEDKDQIPDFHHFYSNEEPPLLNDWLPEYILPTGSQYRKAVWKDYAPGEKYLYSNFATSLLGLIVEQISGMDFRDYCQENIIVPLEMFNSAFRLNDLNPDLMVTPYYDNNLPMKFYTCRHYPAGFLNTNANDFSNFVVACLNYGEFNGKRILRKDTMLKMFEVQNTSSGHGFLWLNILGDSVGKKGGGTGFSTWVEWNHKNGNAMFLFSNKVNSSVWPGGRIYELVKYKCFQ